MCRSQAQGGQRCAAHTRPAYEAAQIGTPEFAAAAAAYASTAEGQRVLEQRFAQAHNPEHSADLHVALARGRALTNAGREAAARISAAQVPVLPAVADESNRVYRDSTGNGWITCHSLTNARRDAARTANTSNAVLLEVTSRSTTGYLEQPDIHTVSGHARVTHNGQGQGFTVTSEDLQCMCSDYQANYHCEHVDGTVAALNARINQERVGPRHAGTVLPSMADAMMRNAAQAGPVNMGTPEILVADDEGTFNQWMDEGRARAQVAGLHDTMFEYETENVTGGLGAPGTGRGFGMEIEFTGGDRAAIGRELYEAGLTATPNQQRYHANHGAVRLQHAGGWSFEEDCTVSGEIISPIMHDTPETWENLAKVCEIVKRNGGRASTNAGAHVHVSTGNFGNRVTAYASLARLCNNHEEILYRAAANPREGAHRYEVGNSYCSPNPSLTSQFQSISTVGYAGAHGHAVNFSPAASGRNTANVEYRMWDSTLDPSVMQTQITTSLALTEAAYAGRTWEPSMLTHRPGLGASAGNTTQTAVTERAGRSLADHLFTTEKHKRRFAALIGASKWVSR